MKITSKYNSQTIEFTANGFNLGQLHYATHVEDESYLQLHFENAVVDTKYLRDEMLVQKLKVRIGELEYQLRQIQQAMSGDKQG